MLTQKELALFPRQTCPEHRHLLIGDTPPWFQAGDEGAVVSEFSTRSRDEFDIFTDTDIHRATIIE